MSLAEIAQLVEHFTRNEGVVGSSPIFGFHIQPFLFAQGRFFCFIGNFSEFSYRTKTLRGMRTFLFYRKMDLFRKNEIST